MNRLEAMKNRLKRAKINAEMGMGLGLLGDFLDDDLPLLLAVAEVAVRLIIRGGDPIFYVGDQSGKCLFCGRTALAAEPHMARRHEPDCMWLLARAAIAPLLEEVTE